MCTCVCGSEGALCCCWGVSQTSSGAACTIPQQRPGKQAVAWEREDGQCTGLVRELGLVQVPGRLGPTCPKTGSGPRADTPGRPWLGCGRNGNLSDLNTSDESQVGHGGPTLACSPPAHLTPASSGQAQSRCEARRWASQFALGFLTLRCRGGRPFPRECQFFFRPLDPFHVLPGIEHKPWAAGGVGGT